MARKIRLGSLTCSYSSRLDVLKVVDFGLSQELDPEGEGQASDAQRIVGTPLYLSPEALTEPASIGAHSDIYAVGAVGYFLLTGVPPFSGNSLVEVCGHHLHSVPVPPSQRLGASLPPTLEGLILSCLAKSPVERPASAASLHAALQSCAATWTQERAARWWATRVSSPPVEHVHGSRDQDLGVRSQIRATARAA
jgi:serine/threonine-protein kinase